MRNPKLNSESLRSRWTVDNWLNGHRFDLDYKLSIIDVEDYTLFNTVYIKSVDM
jgi:hypothetical protein